MYFIVKWQYLFTNIGALYVLAVDMSGLRAAAHPPHLPRDVIDILM